MKITEATYEDSGEGKDRYLSTSIKCAVENNSENTVDMSKGYALILDENGIVIGCDAEREEESFAETGESYSVEFNPYIDYPDHAGDVSKLKSIVDVTSFRREFFKLGEFDCPQDHENPIKSDFTKETGDIRIHGVYILQDRPYEDDNSDDRSIQVRIYVRNISETYIEKVKAKVQLIDKEDAVIETGEDYRNVAPSASNVINAYVSAKKGKLKGASLKVSLSIYYATEHFHAEEPLTKQTN